MFYKLRQESIYASRFFDSSSSFSLYLSLWVNHKMLFMRKTWHNRRPIKLLFLFSFIIFNAQRQITQTHKKYTSENKKWAKFDVRISSWREFTRNFLIRQINKILWVLFQQLATCFAVNAFIFRILFFIFFFVFLFCLSHTLFCVLVFCFVAGVSVLCDVYYYYFVFFVFGSQIFFSRLYFSVRLGPKYTTKKCTSKINYNH